MDDRQAESGAALERAAERLKDAVELLGRDADALILDTDDDLAGDRDRPPR